MLEEIFHQLNAQHFGARLPLPTLRWNSRLASTAGRFSPGRRTFWEARGPEIEVASYLREIPDGAMHVRDTVLHEMIHYFLWFEKRPYGHTAEFHEILRRVGAKRYNTVPKERPFKYHYECPACRTRVPTRKRMGNSACARCCNRFNGGKYDARFRLELADHCAEPAAAMKAEPLVLEEPRLPVSEIIRRLEDLKAMIRKRTP